MAPVAIGDGAVELRLLAVEGKQVPVIRVLRARMGLRLADAHALVKAAPTRIARDLEQEVAEGFRDELQVAGATVQMRTVPRHHLRPVP